MHVTITQIANDTPRPALVFSPVPEPSPLAATERRPLRALLTSPQAVGLAALIGACVFTLPKAGYPLTPYAEYEYQAAMIVALRDHLQWGSQIVWTYGPFGYLNEPAFLDFNSWLVRFWRTWWDTSLCSPCSLSSFSESKQGHGTSR